MATFIASFSESSQFSAAFADSQNMSATFGEIEVIHDTPYYEGDYEATPSQQEQTFSTNGLAMSQDFVVHAIPSNYGLITWNGSALTVS